MTATSATTTGTPILEVHDLVKEFPVRSGFFRRQVGAVQAVSGVSFSVYPGRTLGIVGESGCGKTTTGRCILRLIEPTSGSVQFRGTEVLTQDRAGMRALRQKMQIVFQDPVRVIEPADDGRLDHQRAAARSTSCARARRSIASRS